MRARSISDHQDVVARRLELLRAELAGTRVGGAAHDDPGNEPGEEPGDEWWEGHTRVPEPIPEPIPEPVARPVPEPREPRERPMPEAAAVPVPGRHAARRRWTVDLGALVPEPVRGRVGLGPWQLTVVAVLVALGLAVTCWWVVRSDATPVAAPTPITTGMTTAAPLVPIGGGASASAAPVAATPATSAPSASVSPPSAPGGTVTVDIEGKVRRPGIEVLPTGSRVVDAIRAAGGAPHRRDLAGLNLAAVLADGQQIVVGGPASGTVPVTVPSGSTGPGTASGGLVNLNTATAEELDTLPDVGPVTAQSILEWRDANGGFTSVDELLEVDGIGEATLAKIAPHVTV